MNATISLDAVRAARAAFTGHVELTPVVPWQGEWPEGRPPLLLKCENLQRTGSFKPRGALTFIRSLSPAERARGLVTVSAGNHALGVAYAARIAGCRATVFMPETAPRHKVSLVAKLGARVILKKDAAAGFEEATRLSTENGLTFVHPFDAAQTITGQATLTLELLEQVPGMDLLVMGVGGGGLLAGAVVVLRALRPQCRLVAVEPEGAATLTAARAAGSPVRIEKIDTIADGLAPPYVGQLNFAIVRDFVNDVVLVTDAPIGRAMKKLFEANHLVVEPAGAAAMAAILEDRIDFRQSRHPVCVLSGGNVSAPDFAKHVEALAREGGHEPS